MKIDTNSIFHTPYEHQLYFSWLIPCGSRNGEITGYIYYLAGDYNNAPTVKGPTAITASSVTITGLACATTYRLYVAAINSAGEAPYSDYKTASTTYCSRGE